MTSMFSLVDLLYRGVSLGTGNDRVTIETKISQRKLIFLRYLTALHLGGNDGDLLLLAYFLRALAGVVGIHHHFLNSRPFLDLR